MMLRQFFSCLWIMVLCLFFLNLPTNQIAQAAAPYEKIKEACKDKKGKSKRDCIQAVFQDIKAKCKGSAKGKDRKDCLYGETADDLIAEFGNFDDFGLPDGTTGTVIGVAVEPGAIEVVQAQSGNGCIQVQNLQDLKIETKTGPPSLLVNTYNSIKCPPPPLPKLPPPSKEVSFFITEPIVVQSIKTNHQCNPAASPKLSLENILTGEVFGPYAASSIGDDREAKVRILLPPGEYRVVDSEPDSWLNIPSALKGPAVGFTQVMAVKVEGTDIKADPWNLSVPTGMQSFKIPNVCGSPLPSCPTEFQSQACALITGKVKKAMGTLCDEGGPVSVLGESQGIVCDRGTPTPNAVLFNLAYKMFIPSVKVFHSVDQLTPPTIYVVDVNTNEKHGPFATTPHGIVDGNAKKIFGWKALVNRILPKGQYRVENDAAATWCGFGDGSGGAGVGKVEIAGTLDLPPEVATCGLTFVKDPMETVFAYTGSMQTFKVPPGVKSVTITAFGAQGTVGGGLGGKTVGTFSVTPGETLNVFVGGQGGYNGGGPGYGGSKNGGGASDVRRGGVGLVDRIIVAGGGGGKNGGPGGGLVGGDGAGGGYGGKGGLQTAGGSGGGGSHGGTSGTLGVGGNASGHHGDGGSGGGGGGYYGGGGGGNDIAGGDQTAGGGGGSSYVNPSASGISMDIGVNSGDGRVIIKF